MQHDDVSKIWDFRFQQTKEKMYQYERPSPQNVLFYRNAAVLPGLMHSVSSQCFIKAYFVV
jgi:hypothetical protein